MDIVYLLDTFKGWCAGSNSLQSVFSMINNILGIIRIVVPIALIAMTTVDIAKKVIDPEEKDGQKKIMIRAISAVIVFLIPTLVRITMVVIDWGNGNNGSVKDQDSQLTACWDRA